MPMLPKRFNRLKAVLNCRMGNLTVLMEEVGKPHNLSAILRTCDAVGVLDAHAVSKQNRTPTFNSTAQGSQKWVRLQNHPNIETAIATLKGKGFTIYGTNLEVNSKDFRSYNYCESTAFVLGAEKWGLSESAKSLVDESIYIPMRGMVQSLNVSVAAATLLFEALRQRENAGVIPKTGEGLEPDLYLKRLFEWSYPEIAELCRIEERPYPKLNQRGEII